MFRFFPNLHYRVLQYNYWIVITIDYGFWFSLWFHHSARKDTLDSWSWKEVPREILKKTNLANLKAKRVVHVLPSDLKLKKSIQEYIVLFHIKLQHTSYLQEKSTRRQTSNNRWQINGKPLLGNYNFSLLFHSPSGTLPQVVFHRAVFCLQFYLHKRWMISMLSPTTAPW